MTELSTRISIITNALDILNSFLYLNSVINYFFFALFRSIPACGICITITRYWRSVEAKDMEFSYPYNTPALHSVSFRIRHGESVAIVGANGAGKSTFFLHLNGYLTPTSGQVRIGDFPLTKETLQKVRRTVGMVIQDPDDQLFISTVYDDVAFGPLNLGLPMDEVRSSSTVER